ncbi:MAG TPA: hypothetical protein DCX65_01915 [Spirochaetaceae bacterium]|nr:hypothetical protein [Spirochaetaceae bacterium]
MAALHAPLHFTLEGTRLRFSRLSNLRFQLRQEGVVASTAAGEVVHYNITFANVPALPVPTRRVRVTIPLTSLNLQDPQADSPSLLAMKNAIRSLGYPSGQVWIESITLRDQREFVVMVAIRRD